MDRLKQIRQEIEECNQCLRDAQYQPEFGWGTPGKIMIIGISPGKSNPNGLQGNSPWDEFFLRLIKPFNLTPDDFYFTNLIKIPCNVRELDPSVLEHAGNHVIDEIDAVNPTAIITLGAPPFHTLKKNSGLKGRSLTKMTHPSAMKYGGITKEAWLEEFEQALNTIQERK